jgi:hypothetical protein
MNKAFDGFETKFNTIEDFLGFLKEREAGTIRLTVPASDLKVFNIAHVMHKYPSMDAIAKCLDVDVELVEDTQKHTDLVVAVGARPFLLGDSAMISISSRVQIFGGGFAKLKSATKATVLSERFADLKEKEVKVIAYNGKIRAIMSDEYAVVPMAELFAETIERTEQRFGGCTMIGSYVSHDIARLYILLPKDPQLTSAYGVKDEWRAGLVIETSDNGYSANKIAPFWKCGSKSFIKESEAIYMVHKGNTELDKVLAELPNVFLKYQNVVEKFADLMMVDIQNPVATLKKALKKLKLGKKLSKQVVEGFEAAFASASSVTAYDICSEILGASSYVEDGNNKAHIEAIIGKAINIDYAKLEAEEDDE